MIEKVVVTIVVGIILAIVGGLVGHFFASIKFRETLDELIKNTVHEQFKIHVNMFHKENPRDIVKEEVRKIEQNFHDRFGRLESEHQKLEMTLNSELGFVKRRQGTIDRKIDYLVTKSGGNPLELGGSE